MWLVNIFKNVCLVYTEMYLCFQKLTVSKLSVFDVEFLSEKEKKKKNLVTYRYSLKNIMHGNFRNCTADIITVAVVI